ncbi:hypothetical protein BH09VER1_BH09VER1_33440 [soil metagenome]
MQLTSAHKFLPFLGLAVLLVLTFGARCWNHDSIFVQGRVFYVDADCYSRMTRVQEVAKAPWRPISFHTFENAPLGVHPHTTAPMDLAIVFLSYLLKPFSNNPLELAGAFISPLLGALLAGFLWWWARSIRLPYGNAVLVATFSPILTHGFLLGRPDHQSLILLLTGLALAAELAHWTQPSRRWQILSAVAWALALWTSLFEPLILIIATLLLRFFVLRRAALPDRTAALCFVAVFVGGFLFDGWRFHGVTATEKEYFFRWGSTIGELGHTPVSELFKWTGWLLPIAPFLLVHRFRKEGDRSSLALLLFLTLVTGLTLWNLRWGYFLSLTFALSLPWILRPISWKLLGWLVFLFSLAPVATEWRDTLYPTAEVLARTAENREDFLLLHDAADALISPEKTIILAPWWLSPALAYWSGQPCVAGSSHQSLPGTIDTAKFYLATSVSEAREILKRRQVSYVVAYEPDRIIPNSAQILGVSVPQTQTLGRILYENPYGAPSFLRLVYPNKYFKVYEVTGL